MGTQIKVSEEMMNCPGPSQGCSRTASAPLARHETHHESTFWAEGGHCLGAWDVLWGAGEEHLGAAQDLLWDI